MGFFPEGTRSKDQKVHKGHAGAGFFALRSQAAVVPCVIIGSYKPFHKLRVIFGPAIDFTEMRRQKTSAQQATDEIMAHISELMKENKKNI